MVNPISHYEAMKWGGVRSGLNLIRLGTLLICLAVGTMVGLAFQAAEASNLDDLLKDKSLNSMRGIAVSSAMTFAFLGMVMVVASTFLFSGAPRGSARLWGYIIAFVQTLSILLSLPLSFVLGSMLFSTGKDGFNASLLKDKLGASFGEVMLYAIPGLFCLQSLLIILFFLGVARAFQRTFLTFHVILFLILFLAVAGSIFYGMYAVMKNVNYPIPPLAVLGGMVLLVLWFMLLAGRVRRAITKAFL